MGKMREGKQGMLSSIPMGYRVPALPVGSRGGRKGGNKGRQDRARPKLTAPGITAVRGQDRRAPRELRERVLVYMYLYNSRGRAQRGYIIYTHTYRHTNVVAGKTEVGASS